MTTIDFAKRMKYKGKEWLAEEKKMDDLKGKIIKWRSAQGGDFDEVRRGRLFRGEFPVKKVKMGGTMTEKWTEFRYGKYGEKQLNKSHIDYLKKYMKKFRI